MSTRAHTATRPRGVRRSEARRRAIRRRRIAAIVGTAMVVGFVVALSWPSFHHAVREIALPLRHEDIMQITPATAHMIARKSGGVAFTVEDLGTPQVNIAYGSWYLRYLLRRYAGNETFALAAYNGGEGNVDRWIDSARQRNADLTIAAIPFSETRAYVQRVLAAKRQYRSSYAHELGL